MDIKFDQQKFDIVLSEGGDGLVDFDITSSPDEELMQRLFLRFKTYPRDLFWNLGYGIDYLNDVFGMKRPKSSVDALIRFEILKEPMVEEIIDFSSTIISYSYKCQFSVKVREEKMVSTFHILTNEDGLTLVNESGLKLTTRI